MITFDKNVGGFLTNAIRENKAVHAYIVAGEKQSITKLLTECALACMQAEASGETYNKITRLEHQDVIRIPQDVNKNKLTVADISYLVEETFKRPIDGNSKCRVFLVDASNSVTGIGAEAWQNKLLKTLEEPTEGVFIFIGVTDPEGLLPTIRSRCQILKQSALTVCEVKQRLMQSGFDARSCEIAAAMSGGSVDTAERLLRNGNAFKAFETAVSLAENMSSTKNALQYASAILSVKDNIYDFLQFLTILYRESVVYRLQNELCLLSSLTDTIDKICANYTLQATYACIETINKTKKVLDDNGNVTVAVDTLLNKILEIKYRCRL